jgi:hypothetical protein
MTNPPGLCPVIKTDPHRKNPTGLGQMLLLVRQGSIVREEA